MSISESALGTNGVSNGSPELNQKDLSNPQDKSSLVLLTSVIALGILFDPNFARGFAVGALSIPVKLSIGACLLNTPPVTDEEKKYHEGIPNRLLEAILADPIYEELIFRGAIQPFIAGCILRVIPASRGQLLGLAITIATTGSIVATSIPFGLMHYANYKTAHHQVLNATLGGLVYGLLAAQYGLRAALGAHIGHNAIVAVINSLLKKMGRR